MPTGSSPFILLDLFSFLPLDIITNATTALLNGQSVIPTDQLVSQIDSNGGLATTGTVGAIGAIGTILYKFVVDRKSDLDVVSKGSVTDKMIFNEIIENLGYLVQYFEIEKQILLLEKKNPTMTRAQINEMMFDETTNETIGIHKAKFMNSIIETFHKYYGTTLGTTEISNFSNDPKKILNQTLSLVKDKTGN